MRQMNEITMQKFFKDKKEQMKTTLHNVFMFLYNNVVQVVCVHCGIGSIGRLKGR